MKKLPDFLVIGFPKCGSTSLHYYLDAHPEIFMPKQKELHYLSFPIISKLNRGPQDKYIKRLHIRDYKTYEKQFVSAKKNQIIGEVSPSYVNYPNFCIPKIKETLDNPKIIILVRDPIKRAYSNYLHLKREQRENLSFYEALLKEEERKKNGYSDFWYYKFNSTYYSKIKAFKNAFSHVLIIESEMLKNEPKDCLSEVYDFLNVDSNFTPKNINKSYNEGGLYKKSLLTNLIFKQNKYRDFLRKNLPMKASLKHFKQKLIKVYQEEAPEIDIQSKTLLIESLKEDSQNLKKTYNLSCKNWESKLFE